MIFTNRLVTTNVPEYVGACIEASEREIYIQYYPDAVYLWVVFHELFGRGTRKLSNRTAQAASTSTRKCYL